MGHSGDRGRGLSDSARLMRRAARRGPGLALTLALLFLAGCTTSSYTPIRDSSQQTARAAGGHIVQRGDTLFSIAWKHGLDYQTVAAWNRIPPPYTIYPGQRIQLRPPAATTVRPATPPSAGVRTQPPSTVAKRAPYLQEQESSASLPDAMPVWQWPASGPILRRFDADGSGKKGISIGGTHGSQVRAAAPGQVVYAGSGLVGYGRLIIIKHNDNYLSAYGHNRHLLVNEGDAVRSGQVIAEMGSSGTNRIQLHFEIRRKGKPVDPLRYLPRR